ncbi:hypothetical protein [Vacuolonema iberomarrocanum]|uniref:hypothetical protein n=1 Tax=Vacuolonema iberomarrocanum TaxID=3454632 RepID=UPI0019EFF6A2|nr:hypothetical protein [filamentous cyanobacterium LEGE 07170]
MLKAKIHRRIIFPLTRKIVKWTYLEFALFLNQVPWLYFAYLKGIDPRFPKLAFSRETQLVIEGFPRSANTFAVIAFLDAQDEPVSIAHHLHMPAQIIRAIHRNVPALVLIREPDQAIASLMVRHPAIQVASAFKWYLMFYQLLLEYRTKIVIATFNEVTNNLSRVIQRLNEKFQAQFSASTPCEQGLERIFWKIEQIERDPNKACFPSQARMQKKSLALKKVNSPPYRGLLSEAQQLYSTFTSDKFQ